MAEARPSPTKDKNKIPKFSPVEASDSNPTNFVLSPFTSNSFVISELSSIASSSLQSQISRFSLSLDEGSSSLPIDHLTPLFDELRLHILSLLPFKSAVRTSALSSQWRHLYKKRAQNLNFILDAAASPAEIELSIAGGDGDGRPLDSLHLTAGDDAGGGLLRSNLRRWLSLAALRGVQDLVVSFPQPEPEPEPELEPPVGFGVLGNRPPAADALPFEFPATLIRLALIGSHFARPSWRNRFFSLEVLNLHRLWIGDVDLKMVVACCPVLRTVDIRRCRGLVMPLIPSTARCLRSVTVVECPGMQLIRIESRSLRRFHYSGKVITHYYLENGDEAGSRSPWQLRYPWKFMTGSFVGSGNAHEFEVDEFEVEDVYVSCGDRGGEIDAESMVPESNWWWSTRGMLSHVKVLTLCSLGLRYIAAKVDFLNIPCLRELQLLMKKMTRSNFMDICSFFKLRFCPGLEKLFIELPFYTDMEFSEEFNNAAEEQPAAGVFDNLKIIKMNRFNGCLYQMLLVQVLLLKAIHLESLLISAPHVYLDEAAKYSVNCHSNALHSMRMELVSMVKSENAKIIVCEHDDRRVLPTHYEVY